VIIIGIILLVIGFLTKIAIVWTLGIIAVVVGLVLMLLGAVGHSVGPRRHDRHALAYVRGAGGPIIPRRRAVMLQQAGELLTDERGSQTRSLSRFPGLSPGE